LQSEDGSLIDGGKGLGLFFSSPLSACVFGESTKRNKKETLCELCLPNGIRSPFHRGDSSAAGGEKKLKICHIEKRKKDGFLAETGKLRMA
jgi:hypothetical protein